MRQPEEATGGSPGEVRSLSVGDFMSRDLVTVNGSDDLALAEQMLRLGGIRHLPVVEHGKLVGLLTHRDLLSSAMTRPAATTQARDAMTASRIAAGPTRDSCRAPQEVVSRLSARLGHRDFRRVVRL